MSLALVHLFICVSMQLSTVGKSKQEPASSVRGLLMLKCDHEQAEIVVRIANVRELIKRRCHNCPVA